MAIPIGPMSPPKEACQGVMGRRAIKASRLKGAKQAEELESLQTLGSRVPVPLSASSATKPRPRRAFFVCCGCEALYSVL